MPREVTLTKSHWGLAELGKKVINPKSHWNQVPPPKVLFTTAFALSCLISHKIWLGGTDLSGLREAVFVYLLHYPEEDLERCLTPHFPGSLWAACTDGMVHSRADPAALLGASPPGREEPRLSWQQSLLQDDGLNSVAVAEIVPLRSYHPGKHSRKRFKQTRTHKQSRTLELKVQALEQPCNALSFPGLRACRMNPAPESCRARVAWLPARPAKGVGKRKGGFRLPLTAPNLSDYLHNQRSPGLTFLLVLWWHRLSHFEMVWGTPMF